MNRLLLALICLASPLAAAAADFKAGSIEITQPWARSTTAAAETGIVYLTLRNAGPAADRLIAATTPNAKQTTLHTTIRDGEVMRMRDLQAIDTAPGESVTLKPGGVHLMMEGLAGGLQRGGSFPLTLTFEKAGSVTVTVQVEGPGASGPSHAH